MSLAKFLTSKTFIKHLLAAALLIFLMLIITLQILKIYTRHGESFQVPDFYGLSLAEAEKALQDHSLKFTIIDSVYVKDVDPGAVVDQIPERGFQVKEGRTVFLTINSTVPEKVTLPKLTDISFRQARVLIEGSSLVLGEISYVPSEYNNLVLRVEQDSTEVFEGNQLLKGSQVDLIVGRDPGNEQTTLPDVTGMRLKNALEILTQAMLNAGVYIYDETVLTEKDSLNPFVWKQHPDPTLFREINLGSSVDLWITADSLKALQELKDEPQF